MVKDATIKRTINETSDPCGMFIYPQQPNNDGSSTSLVYWHSGKWTIVVIVSSYAEKIF
jgi:hypothetical protein